MQLSSGSKILHVDKVDITLCSFMLYSYKKFGPVLLSTFLLSIPLWLTTNYKQDWIFILFLQMFNNTSTSIQVPTPVLSSKSEVGNIQTVRTAMVGHTNVIYSSLGKKDRSSSKTSYSPAYVHMWITEVLPIWLYLSGLDKLIWWGGWRHKVYSWGGSRSEKIILQLFVVHHYLSF